MDDLLVYITPSLIIVMGLALWRVYHSLHTDIKDLGRDLREELRRLNDRLDRHLEGHP